MSYKLKEPHSVGYCFYLKELWFSRPGYSADIFLKMNKVYLFVCMYVNIPFKNIRSPPAAFPARVASWQGHFLIQSPLYCSTSKLSQSSGSSLFSLRWASHFGTRPTSPLGSGHLGPLAISSTRRGSEQGMWMVELSCLTRNTW